MIQHATLVVMDAITLIVIRERTMTIKECQSFTESLLADGYKPVDDFVPTKNEAYTNGKYVCAWEFTEGN